MATTTVTNCPNTVLNLNLAAESPFKAPGGQCQGRLAPEVTSDTEKQSVLNSLGSSLGWGPLGIRHGQGSEWRGGGSAEAGSERGRGRRGVGGAGGDRVESVEGRAGSAGRGRGQRGMLESKEGLAFH